MFSGQALAQSTSSITVTLDSASPVTIPLSFNSGDTVTVSAILTTTDPNEDGEGEPLVISGPGCSSTVAAYEFTTTTTCTATAAGMLSAYISGADGDESGTITVTVSSTAPPPPPPGKTDADKANYRNLRDFYGVLAILYTAIAAEPACVAVPGCPVVMGRIAAGDALLAIAFNRLAEDPIDPNYMVIAQPVIFPIPPVVAQLTPAEANALNQLLINQEQIFAYIAVINTTFNRAEGAQAAGDTYWIGQQTQAGEVYLSQLGLLMTSQAIILSNLQSAFQAGGFPNFTVTSANIMSAEQQILTGTGPLFNNISMALGTFGADSATISQALAVLPVQDINAASGAFPARVTDPSLITALQTTGAGLSGIPVGLGMCVPFPVTLGAPAGPNGVFITLTSSDSTTVSLEPFTNINSVIAFIPAGATTPTTDRRMTQVCGVNLGSTVVTVSGGGLSSIQAVQVTATLSFTPASVTMTTTRQERLILNLSAPAPIGGLTVNLSSDNPSVATVQATVTIPANITSVIVPVNGVAVGSTLIHASALPSVPDTTVSVTVM
jgi:hypothetical protein